MTLEPVAALLGCVEKRAGLFCVEGRDFFLPNLRRVNTCSWVEQYEGVRERSDAFEVRTKIRDVNAALGPLMVEVLVLQMA